METVFRWKELREVLKGRDENESLFLLGSDRDTNTLLEDILEDKNVLSTDNSVQFLDLEDYSRISGETSVVVLFSSPYNTMDTILREREQFSLLLDRLDQLRHNGKKSKVLVFHRMIYEPLSNSTIIYPSKFLGSDSVFFTRKFLPRNKHKNNVPTEISLRTIEYRHKDLFQALCQCIYPGDVFSSVEKITLFKANVFLMRVQPRDSTLTSRIEVVKFDAPWKIIQEMENYNAISTNTMGNNAYFVKGSYIFEDEYVGAIRSCAETPIPAGDGPCRFFSLHEYLKDASTDYSTVNNIFIDSIKNNLKPLQKLGSGVKPKPAFAAYQKKILPSPFSLTFQCGLTLNVCDNQKGKQPSILKLDYKADGSLETVEKGEEKCILRLKGIEPRITDIKECRLLFEARGKQNEKFSISSTYRQRHWQKVFASLNLREGLLVEVSDCEQRGYYFELLKVTKTFQEKNDIAITARCREKMSSPRSAERTRKCRRTVLDQYFQTKIIKWGKKAQKLSNPLYFLDQCSRDPDLLLGEYLGTAHGDLHLKNILVHSDKDDTPESIQTSLIDVRAFASDYPLSFDYVKLEVELKNHILVPLVREELNSSDTVVDDFIKCCVQLERYWQLSKNGCTKKKQQSEKQGLKKQKLPCMQNEKIVKLVDVVMGLRCNGQLLYKNASQLESSILYLQQLFFYSLRTLTYHYVITKVPRCAKRDNVYFSALYSFISAAVAVEGLNVDS